MADPDSAELNVGECQEELVGAGLACVEADESPPASAVSSWEEKGCILTTALLLFAFVVVSG